MTDRSLNGWLSYIESQHPAEIALGLDRGLAVLKRLNVSRPDKQIITVAGTNGKGSTCAMLTQFLCDQGYHVGTYTSPHFLKFNERIAINNAHCDDVTICQAFEEIERLREGIPLTYFEFSTLAAFWIFSHSELDYWILEVGLGGRLDSVNMMDADVAVVTSIALDHIDWLGDSLEGIAREKAGIARKGKYLISGVVNPPSSLAQVAEEVGALLVQKGQDYHFKVNNGGWSWSGNGRSYHNLPLPHLPIENAATVLAVLNHIGLQPTQEALANLFRTSQLTGRFQKVSSYPDVYIDVAHNPEAAYELKSRIANFDQKPIAVCGMLKDKDIEGVMSILRDSFSAWYIVGLPGSRGQSAHELERCIRNSSDGLNVQAFNSVQNAFSAANQEAGVQGRAIIIFGSFVTVTEYLAFSQ